LVGGLACRASSPETDLSVPAPSASNLSSSRPGHYEWLADPSRVDEPWRRYFAALPAAPGAAPGPERFVRRVDGVATAPAAAPAGPDPAFQHRVARLVQAYRDYGHLRADLDPPRSPPRRAARPRRSPEVTSTVPAPIRRVAVT
jgi:2-oxoglutarate dehydrogenase E1 component